jgi:hypothetical protein
MIDMRRIEFTCATIHLKIALGIEQSTSVLQAFFNEKQDRSQIFQAYPGATTKAPSGA